MVVLPNSIHTAFNQYSPLPPPYESEWPLILNGKKTGISYINKLHFKGVLLDLERNRYGQRERDKQILLLGKYRQYGHGKQILLPLGLNHHGRGWTSTEDQEEGCDKTQPTSVQAQWIHVRMFEWIRNGCSMKRE